MCGVLGGMQQQTWGTEFLQEVNTVFTGNSCVRPDTDRQIARVRH